MSSDDTRRDGEKSGDVASLTLKILGQIRDEARTTNTRLDATNQRLDTLQDEARATNTRLDATNVHLHELTRATVGGFAEVNRRIDNMLLGEHRDEHQELRRRVERLEHQVGIVDPLTPEGH